ncbi:MAG TPA: hypothetical protein VMI32_12995 [Candidatus Solibacter sp.]|nr:hypothetical protein [Candidatus Solibacter sp.]
MKDNTVCAQLETGTYKARMLEPEMVTFWAENSSDAPGAYHLDYSVVVEETRERSFD